MPRLAQTFEALDPLSTSDVKLRRIGLEQSQIDVLLVENGDISDGVRFSRLLLAAEVTQDPVLVFQNWKRPEHEDGLCYVGRPAKNYYGQGKETPPPPGMVFCVYVKPSGKITDWRWERQDAERPECPEDWKNRFGDQVWPTKLST